MRNTSERSGRRVNSGRTRHNTRPGELAEVLAAPWVAAHTRATLNVLGTDRFRQISASRLGGGQHHHVKPPCIYGWRRWHRCPIRSSRLKTSNSAQYSEEISGTLLTAALWQTLCWTGMRAAMSTPIWCAPSNLWAGKTLYQVILRPVEPPVNSSSMGSCLRLPVLLWLLLQAPAGAQDPELPPPTPPATSANAFWAPASL